LCADVIHWEALVVLTQLLEPVIELATRHGMGVCGMRVGCGGECGGLPC
jgi:hypothetical protein